MSTTYALRHVTRLRYTAPIRESVMEVRKKPLSEGFQRCLQFGLRLTPGARPKSYQDHMGNTIHHFNIPQPHQELVVLAESQVFMEDPPELPERLGAEAWDQLDELARVDLAAWEFVGPSGFTASTPLLEVLADEVGALRRDDPLTVLRDLNDRLYGCFEYRPRSTRVDSPIDEALKARAGVCQDFAHVMLALLRRIGIPCRYVSGYLSAATCITAASTATARRRTPRTPGSRRCCRAWAGSASTPPTGCWRASATSARRWAATTPTCPPPRACSRATRSTSSRWPCRCARWASPWPRTNSAT